MERLNRVSSCMGGSIRGGMQNSRLASQLVAKMMHHSFHERALPLSAQQVRSACLPAVSHVQVGARFVGHPACEKVALQHCKRCVGVP